MGALTSFDIRKRLSMKSTVTDSGCIVWTGCTNSKGYGRTTYNKKYWRVHRLAWHLSGRELPEGMYLDHMCYTPSCFNVEHLRLVSPKENIENFSGLSSSNTSGFRGVSEYREGVWRGRVRHNGKEYTKGGFLSPTSASDWATAKRLELHTHNELDRKVT